MYLMKVYLKKNLVDVKHYNKFENALADIADENFTDNLPDEVYETLGNPKVYYGSRDLENIADDFEFRFDNNVCIYVGVVSTID